MKRREFITFLSGAAVWPLVARADVSTKRSLIAVLRGGAIARIDNSPLSAFVQGLNELGYVDGLNADIVYRGAEEHLDRFPVGLEPDVILATVTPAAVATRVLTKSIPIVCPLLADAINLGLIATDSRPGGNVTGISFRTEGLTGKQVELALQMIPDVVKIGYVVNVASGVIIDRPELESTCQRLGIKAVPAEVRAPNDLEAAFQALANDHVQAVIVLVDGMLFSERTRIAALAAATRLPAIYGFRDHVDAGGLASYGVNLSENFHRAATYVNKILKGAKARPGGNITGVSTDVGLDQWLKRVQLLKEAVPQITRLGVLQTRNVRERRSALSREIALKNLVSIVGPPLERPTDEQEYQRVFSALAQEGADGLLVNDESENASYRRLIVELAEKGRLPTIYPYRQFVEAGGLMAYGVDVSDLGHRVADLVDKILKGAKPGEIPIFQTTHFELSINLQTAKTLGIELPPLLVARADKVIE